VRDEAARRRSASWSNGISVRTSWIWGSEQMKFDKSCVSSCHVSMLGSSKSSKRNSNERRLSRDCCPTAKAVAGYEEQGCGRENICRLINWGPKNWERQGSARKSLLPHIKLLKLGRMGFWRSELASVRKILTSTKRALAYTSQLQLRDRTNGA
jgi:hypothetical protein